MNHHFLLIGPAMQIRRDVQTCRGCKMMRFPAGSGSEIVEVVCWS